MHRRKFRWDMQHQSLCWPCDHDKCKLTLIIFQINQDRKHCWNLYKFYVSLFNRVWLHKLHPLCPFGTLFTHLGLYEVLGLTYFVRRNYIFLFKIPEISGARCIWWDCSTGVEAIIWLSPCQSNNSGWCAKIIVLISQMIMIKIKQSKPSHVHIEGYVHMCIFVGFHT